MQPPLKCDVCGAGAFPANAWIHEKHGGKLVVHTVVHKVVHIDQCNPQPKVSEEKLKKLAEDVEELKSRHGVYANPEERKKYRREWTRKDRERKRNAKASQTKQV